MQTYLKCVKNDKASLVPTGFVIFSCVIGKQTEEARLDISENQ